jgi:competence protein ComGC
MSSKKAFLFQKTKYAQGQGLIEALILLLGIIFIFAIAFPQVSQKAKMLKNKNQEAPVSSY